MKGRCTELRKNKRKKIDEILEIPSGLLSGFTLEIYSASEAVLTGKVEVLDLESTILKLKCNEHDIIFKGNDINIAYYTNEGIKVDGKITSVEME